MMGATVPAGAGFHGRPPEVPTPPGSGRTTGDPGVTAPAYAGPVASAPDAWDQLSRSSKQALRWAGAAARARRELDDGLPDDAEVDEYDLLVGILLAHPRRSEPRALLDHVGATAAELLPPTYPSLDADLLERHVVAVSEDGPPEMADQAVRILQDAASVFVGAAGVVELRGLFGALRSGSNGVATAIYDLLGRVGLTQAADTYSSYLDDPPAGGYGEFLAREHPFTGRPVEIPTYRSDHGPGSMGDDHVDIRAEVDAFAYLLASRALQPPLAVGLFGHWGSGKSYFMEAVRSRIEQFSDAVAHEPQADVPFWKRIVQIEFNAWHYVEGDLWASLVEHVFSELRVHDDEDQTEVAKRQRHWLGKIDEKLRQRGDLLLTRQEKAAQLEQAKQNVAAAEKRLADESDKLAEAERAAADPELESSLPTVRDALAGLVDVGTGGRAGEAVAAIDDARAELRRGLGVVRGFRWSDPRTWASVAALVAVPVVVWLLDRHTGLPDTAQVFAGAGALLAAVTGALRGATAQVRSRLDALDRAATAVRQETEAKQRHLQAEVHTARAKAADAQAAVDRLVSEEEALAGEIDQLRERVSGVTSGALLSEFLSERVGSLDYRQRLGTAALVQRDFRALSKLIEEQNADRVAHDTGGSEPGPDVLNRIILYVDDLDRCEGDRVIEVLQAVHLLLAFPLFVVVVAVDSRWLSESLLEHFPALAGSPGDGEAGPSDYLEKIFQIPFWIDPLSEGSRSAMVSGLLRGNLVGSSTTDHGPDGGALDVDDAQRELLDVMFSRDQAIRMQTAAMGVTATELKFLDGLGPLLGTTPRSVKRFVNLYQLLNALPPVPPIPGTPPHEELTAFLLALAEGLPTVSARVRDRVAEATGPETLAGVMTTLRTELPADVARYDRWIAGRPGWDAFPLEQLRVPAERVRRFSFR
jgi:hypothetical protein